MRVYSTINSISSTGEGVVTTDTKELHQKIERVKRTLAEGKEKLDVGAYRDAYVFFKNVNENAADIENRIKNSPWKLKEVNIRNNDTKATAQTIITASSTPTTTALNKVESSTTTATMSAVELTGSSTTSTAQTSPVAVPSTQPVSANSSILNTVNTGASAVVAPAVPVSPTI